MHAFVQQPKIENTTHKRDIKQLTNQAITVG